MGLARDIRSRQSSQRGKETSSRAKERLRLHVEVEGLNEGKPDNPPRAGRCPARSLKRLRLDTEKAMCRVKQGVSATRDTDREVG